MRIDSVFDMGEESFVEVHEDLFGFTSGYRYKFITVNGWNYVSNESYFLGYM